MGSDALWTRVLATVAASSAELVADALWQFDPAAIEEIDQGETTVLAAGYPDAATAHRAATALAHLGCSSVAVVPVPDDGLDAWRRWARVEKAGPFVLVPAWLDPPDLDAGPADIVMRLEPGRTFGSGSHPTTRAVLGALASRVSSDTGAVLDVGCGSGVLAVGSALLGAGRAHGIDIDADAPAITVTNAEANGVADAVTASNEALADVVAREERYDLVVANLLAPVIVELAPDLRSVVDRGGTLVLSGLLADRWRQTVEPFIDEGAWAVDEVVELEGWVAVVLNRS